MRFTPREPEIPDIGGFTTTNDIFQLKDFAERLSNLVQGVDEPLVIALDGPWGSGKSVFVKQWAGLLRERGASVIRFDAFGNDHHDDAFLALSAEIHDLAKKTLGGNESTTRRYLNKAKKVGVALTPVALRIASRAASAGLLSLDDLEASSEAIKAAVKTLGDESEKVIENAISERLRGSRQERVLLANFRETLSEVATALMNTQVAEDRKFPLVFIVDELDRCRPPFALSVIERVKHLFSVPGVCFILVTHLPQLEQAVQGAYGSTFDAHEYLEKFYQLRIALPELKGPTPTQNQRSAYIAYLQRDLGITFPDAGDGELIEGELEVLAEAYDLSLRQIERVMTNIALVCASVGANRLIIPPIISGLCVMRHVQPALYQKARNNALTWNDAKKFLRQSEAQERENEWSLGWWRFALDKEMPKDEALHYAQGLWKYHVDKEGLVPRMAKYIDDLVQQRGTPQNR